MNPPAPTYSLRELAELSGIKLRTLRRWVTHGAISVTVFRGRATRYEAYHLDEVHAVKRLLGENLSLEAIRARLSRISNADLARFVHGDQPPQPASTGPSAPAAPSAPSEMAATDADLPFAAERWEHITLLPGLKLLVRGDSGSLVRRIAHEIHERYAATKE